MTSPAVVTEAASTPISTSPIAPAQAPPLQAGITGRTATASMVRPEYAIVALRLVIGAWFVKSFVTKLGVVWVGGVVPLPGASARWMSVMPKLLSRYADGNPIGPYRDFLQHVVLPHAAIFSHLTAIGETVVGLGLTLGLLTPLAAAIGLGLVTMYGLAAFWQGPSQIGFHLLLATSLIGFIVVRAGRVAGLDGWLLRRRAYRSLTQRAVSFRRPTDSVRRSSSETGI